MSYYIGDENTEFYTGQGSLEVVGGQTIPVQCLIIDDMGESAAVGSNDWAPLIAVLENPPKDYPQQVGVPLNGLYLTVQYMRAIGKLRVRDEVEIAISREDGADSWSVALDMEEVDTLIGLLKGPTNTKDTS